MNTLFLAALHTEKRAKVGEKFFVIGVKGKGSDLENCVSRCEGTWKILERFHESPNTGYLGEDQDNHILQPAIIQRIK